jgi:hypothetical protein
MRYPYRVGFPGSHCAPGRASEIDDLLAALKKVGREGAGNVAARKALRISPMA